MSFDLYYHPEDAIQSREQMNSRTLGVAELNADDLREIQSAASRIAVQGARYSEGSQRMIDR